MELVQPIRDGPAVPAERQVLRVVERGIEGVFIIGLLFGRRLHDAELLVPGLGVDFIFGSSEFSFRSSRGRI